MLREDRLESNNLTLHFKELEKEINPKQVEGRRHKKQSGNK